MFTKLSDYRIRQFRELWNNNSDEYEFYDLAKKIDNRLTFAKFDYGWQYCTILNENFKIATNEFLIAINGTF